jgi:hypothetical protein
VLHRQLQGCCKRFVAVVTLALGRLVLQKLLFIAGSHLLVQVLLLLQGLGCWSGGVTAL